MKRRILFAWMMCLAFQIQSAWGLGELPPPQPKDQEWNVQGLWWAQGGAEPGWGLNISHQNATVYATWFTYDNDGSPMWLVMSNAQWDRYAGSYSGRLHRATGPYFADQPWRSSEVHMIPVGTARLSFTSANQGIFQYSFDADRYSGFKVITRYEFASPAPNCDWGYPTGADPNYTDAWWHSPAGSESGWAVSIAHQGDVLFAIWYTYVPDGRDEWVVMSNGTLTGPATYSGALHRARGPSVRSGSWKPSDVTLVPAGNATFTFLDNENGIFAFTLDGVTGSKPITRYVYATPGTVCQ